MMKFYIPIILYFILMFFYRILRNIKIYFSVTSIVAILTISSIYFLHFNPFLASIDLVFLITFQLSRIVYFKLLKQEPLLAIRGIVDKFEGEITVADGVFTLIVVCFPLFLMFMLSILKCLQFLNNL